MSMAIAAYGQTGTPLWSPWTGEALPVLERGFTWIDVVDPHDDEIALLQRTFGLHDLAIEDSMSDAQPAKLDLYSDHIFIVAKVAELESDQIAYTDISIFLAKGRVITICRSQSPFNQHLRNQASRIAAHPRKGPDYVVHGVLDLIVDRYFPVMQGIADEILLMERRLMRDPLLQADIERIFQFRRETVHFQHVVTRMTEVCNKLATIDLPCLSEESKPYFRDVLDNLMRIEARSIGLMDVIRAAFEASNLVEQQRQSEITRQLAAWAGILGVPTAMAGIYGMNFANLPGTGSQWGYLAVLGAMGSACGLLYWRFRSLGWLRPSRHKAPSADRAQKRKPT
jgi:magnesium transporter